MASPFLLYLKHGTGLYTLFEGKFVDIRKKALAATNVGLLPHGPSRVASDVSESRVL